MKIVALINQRGRGEKTIKTIKVEEYKINNLIDYLKILEKYNFDMFRGHADGNWKLLPKIGRMFKLLEGYQDWKTFEDDILLRFQKYGIQYLKKEPKNMIEWLVIGQHHGLPTRLLDWTKNPLKALFFSIIELPNIDGCVWAYELSFWSEKLENLDKIDCLNPYYPDQINERLIAQEGCFTLHPFPQKNVPLIPIENIKFHHKSIRSLVKIIIPNKKKDIIRFDLDKFGINYRSLFPDLDGLTKQLYWEL